MKILKLFKSVALLITLFTCSNIYAFYVAGTYGIVDVTKPSSSFIDKFESSYGIWLGTSFATESLEIWWKKSESDHKESNTTITISNSSFSSSSTISASAKWEMDRYGAGGRISLSILELGAGVSIVSIENTVSGGRKFVSSEFGAYALAALKLPLPIVDLFIQAMYSDYTLTSETNNGYAFIDLEAGVRINF